MSNQDKKLSCTDCGVPNCYRKKGSYPQFCLTTNTNSEEFEVTGHNPAAALYTSGFYYKRLLEEGDI